MPTVAACVITYRRPEGLAKLLEHLAVQEGIAPTDLQVVVVDNDPAHSAQAVVRSAEKRGLALEYADEPIPGIPRARNRSVELGLRTGARYLCFIDDDEFPQPGWLARLLDHAARADVPVVTGPVLSVLPDGSAPWLSHSRLFTPRRYATGTPRDRAFTGNALVHRRVFETMDRWFAESMQFTGGTDTDFFRRANLEGFAIEWCDEAVAYEDVPSERCTLRWMARRNLRQGLGSARFRRLYDHRRTGLIRLLALGAYRIAVGAALSVLTLGLVPSLRLRLVENLASGAGLLLGGFGVKVDEYRRSPDQRPLVDPTQRHPVRPAR